MTPFDRVLEYLITGNQYTVFIDRLEYPGQLRVPNVAIAYHTYEFYKGRDVLSLAQQNEWTYIHAENLMKTWKRQFPASTQTITEAVSTQMREGLAGFVGDKFNARSNEKLVRALERQIRGQDEQENS